MNNDQFDTLKEKLTEERERLLRRVAAINNQGLGSSMSNSIGELSMYDNEPADIGSELFDRGKDLALRERAKIEIGWIDDALERMKTGRYGWCVSCGSEIGIERLKAVPYTDVCINCAQKKNMPGQSRPVEEDVMERVMAQSDRESNAGYDMEDAWQDVARYSEHAEEAGAGAYYGGGKDLSGEDVDGIVQDIEGLPSKGRR